MSTTTHLHHAWKLVSSCIPIIECIHRVRKKNYEKNYETACTFVKVIRRKLLAFSGHGVFAFLITVEKFCDRRSTRWIKFVAFIRVACMADTIRSTTGACRWVLNGTNFVGCCWAQRIPHCIASLVHCMHTKQTTLLNDYSVNESKSVQHRTEKLIIVLVEIHLRNSRAALHLTS